MGLNPKAIDQLEQDLADARDTGVGYQINPGVSDDAKMIAAAIVQAGAQIALAIAVQDA